MQTKQQYTVLLAVLLLAVAAGAKGTTPKYIVPLSNGTPVFAGRLHRNNESPEFRIDRSDRCTVTGESRGRFRISTVDGRKGWIGKSSVKTVEASRYFQFGNAAVQGFPDDPDPVYIIDADDPGNVAIRLDRSFSDELRDNVDRPTLSRRVETGYGLDHYRFE
jgi:hypothetical protein